MKDPGQYRKKSSWIDGFLSEEAQRSFLVGSGCIIFLLAAVVLSLDNPSVPHEIRVYSWPTRVEGTPVQLRAIGFDKRTHRFESVGLCSNEKSSAPGVAQGVALPLLLTATQDIRDEVLCLEIPSWEEREFKVPLPPSQPKDHVLSLQELRETQAFASAPYPKFPYAHMAVPMEGVYNPMNPNAELLFWLDAVQAKVQYEVTPKNFADVQHAPNGLYRIPIQNRGLIGKTVVRVEVDGKTYTRTFQFHPRTRHVMLKTNRQGKTLDLELRLVDQKTNRAHDHAESNSFSLICSVMAGSTALRSVPLRLDSAKPLVTHHFEWNDAPNELLGVICDPNPLGGDTDSVSTLALPSNSTIPVKSLVALARTALPALMLRSMARRVLGWYAHGTTEEKARAKEILLATLQPAPVEMLSVASSYAADIHEATSAHDSIRGRIFGVLTFLLALWVLLMFATLMQRRSIRTQAIAQYLSDDPDEEVAAAILTSGQDALARPKSSLLAFSMVAILLLHIFGLLWVLWTL